MYVCVCNAITDKQVKQAVEGGACSLKQLKAELGVASQCCMCAKAAREIINDHMTNVSPCGGCQGEVSLAG